MPSLAAYPSMMHRDRNRDELRVCRAAWLIGVSVREYREMKRATGSPSSTFGTGSASCTGDRRRS
jgi:hypothetical protein